MPREPHHDHAGADAEHDLGDHRDDEEADSVAVFAAKHRAIDDRSDDAREEDHERVHDALNQRQRHHVAVRDMADFVAEHGAHFIGAHVVEQAGADRDECVVLARAGCECVWLRRSEHRYFRHADAGLLGEFFDGIDEPALRLIARLVDHLRTGGTLRHPLRYQQRDERATHAEHGCEDQASGQVEPDALLIHELFEAEHAKRDARDQQDRNVSSQKQENTHRSNLTP